MGVFKICHWNACAWLVVDCLFFFSMCDMFAKEESIVSLKNYTKEKICSISSYLKWWYKSGLFRVWLNVISLDTCNNKHIVWMI